MAVRLDGTGAMSRSSRSTTGPIEAVRFRVRGRPGICKQTPHGGYVSLAVGARALSPPTGADLLTGSSRFGSARGSVRIDVRGSVRVRLRLGAEGRRRRGRQDHGRPHHDARRHLARATGLRAASVRHRGRPLPRSWGNCPEGGNPTRRLPLVPLWPWRNGGGRTTPMYGPAVRRKRFSSSCRLFGLASMYPASVWSVCSGPPWISAHLRSHYRPSLKWAIWGTSVRKRREDPSSNSSHPLADLGGK
jgi:hypothetical protein